MENTGVGLELLGELSVGKLLMKSVVSWILFDGSERKELFALALEVSMFSIFDFKFGSLSKGTDLFAIVFKPSVMFCVVFTLRYSSPWLPRSSKLNKVEIDRIWAEVSIVAFFGIGVIKGNLEENNNIFNY